MKRRSTLAALCVFGVFLDAGGATTVAAEDSVEALIRHGIELRRGGDDQAARLQFRRAYDMGKTARAAAQLGLCEQALGRWSDAYQHLTEARRAAGDSWVEKNRETIERSLGIVRTHIGYIEISGTPEGAEVIVNGHLVGKLPLADAVAVSAGLIDVELRAARHKSATTSTQVAAGQTSSVVLRLEAEATANATSPPPVSAAAAASETTPTARPPAATAGSSSAAVVTLGAPAPEVTADGADLQKKTDPVDGADQPRPVYKKPWFWIVTGVVVAGAAGAVFLLTRPRTKYMDVSQTGTFDHTGM